MNRILGVLTVVAVLAIGAAPSLAETLLGSRTVAYNSETDVIQVPGAARYRSVRFCVVQRAVHFRDLDVVFRNGGQQDLQVRSVIPAGDCTRWINLRGPRRNIARIVLRYDTLDNSGPRAVVRAYGR